MKTDRCRACGERIMWAKTVKGKSMPLDVDPVMGGNVVLANNIAVVLKKAEIDPGRTAYQSHFASCTEYDRAEWTKQ